MARRQFRVRRSSLQLIDRVAAGLGISRAELIRTWTQDFIDHGTTYLSPDMVKVEAEIPDKILAEADAIAEAHGFTLRDVLLHNLTLLERGGFGKE